jgi:hypothetical protein
MSTLIVAAVAGNICKNDPRCPANRCCAQCQAGCEGVPDEHDSDSGANYCFCAVCATLVFLPSASFAGPDFRLNVPNVSSDPHFDFPIFPTSLYHPPRKFS